MNTNNTETRPALRGIKPEDRSFLEALYFTTRRAEFENVGWNEQQINAFLSMQFDMQARSYEMQYPHADFSIIELGGENAGRLIVDRTENEIRLVDIAVLPEFQGRGIGTFFLRELQKEAESKSLPVTLQVLKTNQNAISLYEKCGFAVSGGSDLYLSMRWNG